MRDNLVKQAVNFLSNPGLASTSAEKKREFLKGKGLTDEEVDEAQRRVEEREASGDAGAGAAPASAGPAATAPAPAAATSKAVAPSPPGAVSRSLLQVPGRAAAAAYGGVALQPAARPTSLQAVLLLQRRLAELEHERACYMEALETLGGVERDDSATLTAPQTSTPAVPSTAPTMTSAPPVPLQAVVAPTVPSGVPGVGPTAAAEPANAASAAGSAAAGVLPSMPQVPSATAKKPWEVASGARSTEAKASGAVAPADVKGGTGGGGALQEDDPDLVDVFPPPKSKI
mmetsp:Transcript_129794/g.361658  ORF Transcript_129794/g.361658 Transcript_129794/m.361658 type:complete len:287 (-) Transcript_129794:164-1024(-)